MSDRLERDADGNVIGKAVGEHPQEPSEMTVNKPKAMKTGVPSTLASRAAANAGKTLDVKLTQPPPNSTLADRTKAAKANQQAASKRVGDAENKSVEPAKPKRS